MKNYPRNHKQDLLHPKGKEAIHCVEYRAARSRLTRWILCSFSDLQDRERSEVTT